MTQHPYCYPGTDVLKNLEGIRDKAVLEEFEREHSGDRLLTLPPSFAIPPAGFRAIHRYLLQDVYEWAGKYRWVNTGRTAPFCKFEFIPGEMDRRFAAVRLDKWLRGLAPETFAERAAEHVNELNAIHPFLDGNGRTQRAFLEVLARQAGHVFDVARVDADAWNAASILGFHKQDHEPMRVVISAALAPRDPRL